MLKVSIIEQRAREVSESRSYLQEQEYREQLNKVNQAFDAIKRILPDNIREQLSKLFDEYLIANDKMHIVIEREAYKQGLVDGIEINKLLT
ncbi:hypothetical protein [Petroclostridium xylanilyticum]|jgi:ATP-dependent protease ClpP protease subunit|uniref:hypothetical protein n=1 Tax=Petroclostridium xylanilyticum TaxID=1792311 RepID=UPI000B980450|nr:hypothetical protein [Petroclostridium xylanilyticum]